MKNRYFNYLFLAMLGLGLALPAAAQIKLEVLGSVTAPGDFDDGGTEIIAYDPETQQIFSTNGSTKSLDIYDVSDPTSITLVKSVEFGDLGDAAQSVSFSNGIVAVALGADNTQDNGKVAFYDTDGLLLSSVEVGALPDMLTFSPDGSKVLVACEGEPNDDYTVDPEGTIAVIDIPEEVSGIAQSAVTLLDFNAFDDQKAALIESGVRIFGGTTPYSVASFSAGNDDDADTLTLTGTTGNMIADGAWITLDSDNTDGEVDFVRLYQVDTIIADSILVFTTEFDYDRDGDGVLEEGTNIDSAASRWTVYHNDASATVSEDLEPEYIAVSPDGTEAWVTLQENNAVAVVSLATGAYEITDISPLGLKDHSVAGNGIDGTDNNEAINIDTYPLNGMYMPDAIASYEIDGTTYYFTANEGDAREYDGMFEEISIEDMQLDATAFPNADDLQDDDTAVGDLNATVMNGDTDGDGDFDAIWIYGARSFTIWDGDGLVWDSKDDFEQITAELLPNDFNSSNDDASEIDNRSDNKGPEPEAITVAEFNGVPYAFIALERIGGVMVYDVSDPTAPEYITYVNNRDFAFDDAQAKDLGPEDVVFISADDSPTEDALLLVSNEVSGTITAFKVASLDTATVSFTTTEATVAEGDGTTTISVSIANPLANEDVSVDVVLASGSETAVSGFDSETVTFPAGSTDAKTITVTILDNTNDNADAVVTFELENAEAGGVDVAEIGDNNTFTLTITDDDESGSATGSSDVTLTVLGSVTAPGDFDDGGTEIIAYDPNTMRVFSTNGSTKSLDIFNAADPTNVTLVTSVEFGELGAAANSVAYSNGTVAVALEADDKQADGRIVFYDTDGTYLADVDVSALPDMLTFTPDGTKVLVAGEGEPNDDYTVDPEGTVSVISIPADVSTITQDDVSILNFNAFNGQKEQLIAEGVRIFGGTTPYSVASFSAGNDDDADTLTLTGTTGGMITDGAWITLDSDNEDDDVDFVLLYQVDTVIGDSILVFTTEFDYGRDDAEEIEEGTNIDNPASQWTVYHNDASATVSEDLEPEYIAVSPDGTEAWVTLQENNAVAVVSLGETPEITEIFPLGLKDHSADGNGIDGTDNNEEINIANYPLHGMYMPDAIASYEIDGTTYYFTANEGDAREYDGMFEEISVEDMELEESVFGDFPNLQDDDIGVGDLNATVMNGDTDGDGDFDKIWIYGARSFTVWDADGLVWDSKDEFEQITAELLPDDFNSSNDDASEIDNRSDNKGPEPEAITVGELYGTPYAFIALERVGGIMVYDVSNPMAPEYKTYINNRDFDFDDENAKDLGPEDVKFIDPENSPTGEAMLIVSNEVSGTITFYGFDAPAPDTTMVAFSAASGTVAEADGTTTLTVSITNPDADNATTVNVALADGSDATAVGDFLTQTVTFAAGSSDDQTVTVTITDNDTENEDVTVAFELANLASDGDNVLEIGTNDTFTLTISDDDEPVATGLADVLEGVSVYPNPAERELTVALAEGINAQGATIAVYTVQGVKVMDQEVSGATTSINVGDLDSGMYLVKVTAEEKTAVIRFQVAR